MLVSLANADWLRLKDNDETLLVALRGQGDLDLSIHFGNLCSLDGAEGASQVPWP